MLRENTQITSGGSDFQDPLGSTITAQEFPGTRQQAGLWDVGCAGKGGQNMTRNGSRAHPRLQARCRATPDKRYAQYPGLTVASPNTRV